MVYGVEAVVNWTKAHGLRILGAALVLFSIELSWKGLLTTDLAALMVVAGLSFWGIAVKVEQAHAALADVVAAIQARADGDKKAMVADLRRAIADLKQPAATPPANPAPDAAVEATTPDA